MEKFSTSFILIFFAVISGNHIVLVWKVNASSCSYLETIGGGCPNGNLCRETCRPCYVGIGVVLTYCVAPGGGINYWRCRCTFKNGAPCPVPGRVCPAPGLSTAQHIQYGYRNKTDDHL